MYAYTITVSFVRDKLYRVIQKPVTRPSIFVKINNQMSLNGSQSIQNKFKIKYFF